MAKEESKHAHASALHDEPRVGTSSIEAIEAEALKNPKNISLPLEFYDVFSGIGAKIDAKICKWSDQHIPSAGQGRTIIHMHPDLTIALVWTTEAEGKPAQPLNLTIPDARK